MPGQAYGYEECEDGTLKKQDPPDKDKSLGPAFYNPGSVRLSLCRHKGEKVLASINHIIKYRLKWYNI